MLFMSELSLICKFFIFLIIQCMCGKQESIVPKNVLAELEKKAELSIYDIDSFGFLRVLSWLNEMRGLFMSFAWETIWMDAL